MSIAKTACSTPEPVGADADEHELWLAACVVLDGLNGEGRCDPPVPVAFGWVWLMVGVGLCDGAADVVVGVESGVAASVAPIAAGRPATV